MERSLADAMLSMGSVRQNSLATGTLLSSRPIADTEVHLLLDGILLIEYDGNPVLEAGPGAIFDPTLRTPESKLHVTVRARPPCRLAVRRRDSAGERESSRRRRTTNGAAGRTSAPNLEDAERATALPPGICPPSPDYARTSSTGTRA